MEGCVSRVDILHTLRGCKSAERRDMLPIIIAVEAYLPVGPICHHRLIPEPGNELEVITMSKKKPAKRTLTDDQIKSARFNRRGILGIAGVASVATLTGCQTAGPTGLTDADAGSFADPAGNGRGSRTSGLTDADSGAFADPAGNGRGRRTSGLTDSDSGAFADPAGNGSGGRRATGLTDSDSGPGADPAGNGRRGW